MSIDERGNLYVVDRCNARIKGIRTFVIARSFFEKGNGLLIRAGGHDMTEHKPNSINPLEAFYSP
ncbi:MAG: hypothetical protein ABJB85_11615 [Nitrososphaerota archaeon]